MKFRYTLDLIRIASQQKTKIGKPVQVVKNLGVDFRGSRQRDATAFCATGYSAGQMQSRGCTRAPREDELPQWKQRILESIDFMLQVCDFIVAYALDFDIGSFRSRDLCTDGEKVALYVLEHRVHIVRKLTTANDTQLGIQFIQGSARFNKG